MTGLLGKKLGTIQLYNDKGEALCVTAIEAGPCPVLSVKPSNIQIGFDVVGKDKHVKKPMLEFFKKLNIKPQRIIKEVLKESGKEYKVGDELKVDMFEAGDYVDVTGTSKGKGFQGGMKRWHWHGGPKTHGSTSHRRVGSIGSTTTPGRVWKGHHLPGHMGSVRVTVQNLRVFKVDAPNNVLLIEGAVPGNNNGYIMVKKAKKKIKPAAAKKG